MIILASGKGQEIPDSISASLIQILDFLRQNPSSNINISEFITSLPRSFNTNPCEIVEKVNSKFNSPKITLRSLDKGYIIQREKNDDFEISIGNPEFWKKTFDISLPIQSFLEIKLDEDSIVADVSPDNSNFFLEVKRRQTVFIGKVYQIGDGEEIEVIEVDDHKCCIEVNQERYEILNGNEYANNGILIKKIKNWMIEPCSGRLWTRIENGTPAYISSQFKLFDKARNSSIIFEIQLPL